MKNTKEAITWFEKALGADIDVHFDLAQAYWKIGRKEDASRHYRSVGENHESYPLSVFRVGTYAEEQKRWSTAQEMYTKGFAKGHEESIFRLAVLNQEGYVDGAAAAAATSMSANPREAIRLYEMLIPRGHSEARRRLGILSYRLYGQTHSQDYLEKSVRAGYVAAQRIMAESSGSDTEALSWYRKAASGNSHFRQGDAVAMFRLGEIFRVGTFGQSPNPKKAYKYFKDAADKELSEAAKVVAENLHAGWPEAEVCVDLQAAKRYYVHAGMQEGVDHINRTLVAGAIEKLSALEGRYYRGLCTTAFADTKENRVKAAKSIHFQLRLSGLWRVWFLNVLQQV